MAQQTFLQLVNAVMVELREDTVGTVSSTAYSTLIGRFVNKAKAIVEDAWDWAALRTSISVSSDGSNRTFTLTGSNERSKLLADPENPNLPMAFDVTSGRQFQLYAYPLDVLQKRVSLGITTSVAVPSDFGLYTAGTTLSVYFDYIPETGHTYQFLCYVPQDDLSSDSTTLTVPWRPVVEYAAELARHERGEEIGEPNTIGSAVYRQLLSDAIALDAFNRRDQYTFSPS